MMKILTNEKKTEILDFIKKHPHEFRVMDIAKKFGLSTRTAFRFLGGHDLPLVHNKVSKTRIKKAENSEYFDWNSYEFGVL